MHKTTARSTKEISATNCLPSTWETTTPPKPRVLHELGLRREAEFREYEYFTGRWWDGLIYTILDHEWRTKHERNVLLARPRQVAAERPELYAAAFEQFIPSGCSAP